MPMLVQDHYGATDIVKRILAAAQHTDTDGPLLPVERLFPYDQLHGRELLATKDHAVRLNPTMDAHLLDVGSGIGGPARYFASVFGCRVTGVDLTPQFVAAATELTRLTGLAGSVDFIEGDVAELPFEPDAFDHTYCFYVGMNLPDKPAVLRECFRVLRPGGLLLWTEVTSGLGDPHYPLPWARDAAGSHVGASETLAGNIRDAGFEVLSVDDETDAHLELAQQIKAAGRAPTEVQLQANEVVLGPDFVERRMNYIRSLADRALASTVICARKTGAEAAS
jgi:SAM-dependent methyltransferase